MVVDAVAVGAGQRGFHVYGAWAQRHPDRLRFAAVVDPNPDRLWRFGEAHRIPDERRFKSTDALWASGRLAQVCIIAGPDRMHEDAAVKSLEAGYHTLVEKPMATSLEGARAIRDAAARHPGRLHVAHVLRYTPYFRTLHQVITSGRLGDIVTVEHRENVWAFHMAHSFVRGNWGTASASAPMIVTKCCHDFDILTWNVSSPIRRLASTGSLTEFHPDRAPAGAPERCTDGCPAGNCPYDARRIYLDERYTGWPVHVITDDLSPAGRLAALQTGPYGRCAYRARSDVADHQVVMMETEAGTSISLTMHGHSDAEERTMRYDGTRATVRGRFGRSQQITIADHATGSVEDIPIPRPSGGHGGGDEGTIEALLAAVSDGTPTQTPAEEAFESHLLGFLAEEARLAGTWIEVGERR